MEQPTPKQLALKQPEPKLENALFSTPVKDLMSILNDGPRMENLINDIVSTYTLKVLKELKIQNRQQLLERKRTLGCFSLTTPIHKENIKFLYIFIAYVTGGHCVLSVPDEYADLRGLPIIHFYDQDKVKYKLIIPLKRGERHSLHWDTIIECFETKEEILITLRVISGLTCEKQFFTRKYDGEKLIRYNICDSLEAIHLKESSIEVDRDCDLQICLQFPNEDLRSAILNLGKSSEFTPPKMEKYGFRII